MGDLKNSKFDTIHEEEKSDLEDKDESPIPSKNQNPKDTGNKKQRRKSGLDLATVEDKQVTFVSAHSGAEEEEVEEISDTEMVNQ